MVKEGYKFGLPPLVLGGVLLTIGWHWAGGILVFVALFVFYFFRDPPTWSTGRADFTARSVRGLRRRTSRTSSILIRHKPEWSSNKLPERLRGACYAGSPRAKQWPWANAWA